MGTYVNNGIVLIPNEHKFGEAPDILSELGGLLGVGKPFRSERFIAFGIFDLLNMRLHFLFVGGKVGADVGN